MLLHFAPQTRTNRITTPRLYLGTVIILCVCDLKKVILYYQLLLRYLRGTTTTSYRRAEIIEIEGFSDDIL